MHEVGEDFFSVHENDRNALAVAPLELCVARDVDLLELERAVALDPHEHATGSLAEVAALRVEQRQDVSARDRAHV
jgi:hypothetical protein